MCSNYDIVPGDTSEAALTALFEEYERLYKVGAPQFRPRAAAVFPLGLAPFVRLKLDGSGERIVEEGQFGLLPTFAKEVAFGKKTYNARSETVHLKPSFRDSWRRGLRCVIPAARLYEQCYETGKAVRWAVETAGGSGLLSVAGIYTPWTDPDGVVRGTFAMLTVNADGHPVYARFQAPGEEKRMVVLLANPEEVDRWLTCTPDEAKAFFRQSAMRLEAYPRPRTATPKAAR